MFNRIRHRLMLQRWLNIVIETLYWASLFVGVLVIVMHRLIGVSGAYVPMIFLCVPVVSWFWLRRTPILDRAVIHYAESVTGLTGWLWFGSEIEDSDWQERIKSQWSTVPIPELTIPVDWKGMVLALCVAFATLWIPIKSATQFQPLVESEMTRLESTLEQLETLIVEDHASIEEWREQISELSKEDKVSSILRQSDYLQEQMNQRQSDMMEAIQEGIDALESGEEQSMTQAMKSLQEQGLIPKSAKDDQALASQSESGSQQGQSQPGEQDSISSKGQANQTQNGQQNASQNQSTDKQSNPNGEQQQSNSSQNGNSSAQQQREQLQQQMSQIQERMKQMQQQQQSSGVQSLNNEQLKQMQQQMQQMSQQAQSGEGQSPGAQPGQSQAEGSNENGEPCELGTPNCVPSKGGDTVPLTYEMANPLPVSDGNLASIQGVTEVDWNSNVYFGQGAGEFSGTASSQINAGTVSGSTADSSFNNERIPPNQRGVVQRFFSTSSSNQGVNDDNNTQP